MSIEAMKLAREKLSEVKAILDQAIAEAEKQEPYGYLWFTHHMERRFTHYKPKAEQRIGDVKPVYAQPVDAVNMKQERVDETQKQRHDTALQPQREWVGLTDEERFELAIQTGAMTADWLPFMEAVEAKLKAKNL